MRIKMLETRRVSPDGHAVLLCEEGREYDLPEAAAVAALTNGWAYNLEPATPMDEYVEQLKAVIRRERERLEDSYRATRPILARPTNPATLIAAGRLEA